MDKIRILIADDHAMFRDGLQALLRSLPDTVVVGEAANGLEAVAQAETLRPDIVLMDIQMPEMDGVEATRRILLANPNIGVIVITMFEDEASVFTAMCAGARGYFLKGDDQTNVLNAIRTVSQGQAVFGAGVAQRMANYFAVLRQKESPQAFPELTDREREILDLMARDHSNQAIAERLGLSLKTVQNHVSNIVNKLQVANRTQAIIQAREAGLGGERAK